MHRKVLGIILIGFMIISCSSNKESDTKEKNQTIIEKGDSLDNLIELKNNEKLTATVQTNIGTFEIELYARDVPRTVKNFAGLAIKGYYNGIIFHRVIKNFMIQGGDPTGTGMGGESIYGAKFEDEFVPSLMHDSPGIVSMANAGPNTNGSQFFITVVPTPWLNARHSVFGKVIKGMDVINAISQVPTNNMDRPIDNVVMQSVTIEKRAF
ncbi:MAG: peptidylprolyl isomerase [Bacteroidota bacterium]